MSKPEAPMGAEELKKADLIKKSSELSHEAAATENEADFFRVMRKGLDVAREAKLVEEANHLTKNVHSSKTLEGAVSLEEVERGEKIADLTARYNALMSGYEDIIDDHPDIADEMLVSANMILEELDRIDPQIKSAHGRVAGPEEMLDLDKETKDLQKKSLKH